MDIKASKIFDTAYESPWDFSEMFRWEYSGRGMYGKKCFALIGNLQDFAAFMLNVVPLLTDSEEDSIEWTRVSMDNMGYDFVYYWPSITVDVDVEEYSENR